LAWDETGEQNGFTATAGHARDPFEGRESGAPQLIGRFRDCLQTGSPRKICVAVEPLVTSFRPTWWDGIERGVQDAAVLHEQKLADLLTAAGVERGWP
jgi:hypothetical protein